MPKYLVMSADQAIPVPMGIGFQLGISNAKSASVLEIKGGANGTRLPEVTEISFSRAHLAGLEPPVLSIRFHFPLLNDFDVA